MTFTATFVVPAQWQLSFSDTKSFFKVASKKKKDLVSENDNCHGAGTTKVAVKVMDQDFIVDFYFSVVFSIY